MLLKGEFSPLIHRLVELFCCSVPVNVIWIIHDFHTFVVCTVVDLRVLKKNEMFSISRKEIEWRGRLKNYATTRIDQKWGKLIFYLSANYGDDRNAVRTENQLLVPEQSLFFSKNKSNLIYNVFGIFNTHSLSDSPFLEWPAPSLMDMTLFYSIQ